MPGTQQGPANLETVSKCDNCHGGYATALRAAGCPISPLRSLTADHLMAQTRKLGQPIQSN
jgi:hypothetical protein